MRMLTWQFQIHFKITSNLYNETANKSRKMNLTIDTD